MARVLLQAGHHPNHGGAPGEAAWTFDLANRIARRLRDNGVDAAIVGDWFNRPPPPETGQDWDLFVALHYDAAIYGEGRNTGCFADRAFNETRPHEADRLITTWEAIYPSGTGIPLARNRRNPNTNQYYGFEALTNATPGVLLEHGCGAPVPTGGCPPGGDCAFLHGQIDTVAELDARAILAYLDVGQDAPLQAPGGLMSLDEALEVGKALWVNAPFSGGLSVSKAWAAALARGTYWGTPQSAEIDAPNGKKVQRFEFGLAVWLGGDQTRFAFPRRGVDSAAQPAAPPLAGRIWPFDGIASVDPLQGGWAFCQHNDEGVCHPGVDLNTPGMQTDCGLPVYALDDAEVVYASTHPERGFGNHIWYRTDHGFWVHYCHLERATVTTGERVADGQQIGKCGGTGGNPAWLCHLHMEVRQSPPPNNDWSCWPVGWSHERVAAEYYDPIRYVNERARQRMQLAKPREEEPIMSDDEAIEVGKALWVNAPFDASLAMCRAWARALASGVYWGTPQSTEIDAPNGKKVQRFEFGLAVWLGGDDVRFAFAK